jgi:hypothetical protein
MTPPPMIVTEACAGSGSGDPGGFTSHSGDQTQLSLSTRTPRSGICSSVTAGHLQRNQRLLGLWLRVTNPRGHCIPGLPDARRAPLSCSFDGRL